MDTPQNPDRQEILYRYIAKKALQDLRNRDTIDTPVLQFLNTYPLFNYCRIETGEDDKDILKDTASLAATPLPLRRFCIKLLRKFELHPDIKFYFYDLWLHSDDYEIKLEVLWSLLGYSDLSQEIFAEISNHFNAANWDKWLPLIVEKLEGNADEKSHVRELMKRYFNID